MEKTIPELKSEFVCMCVRERQKKKQRFLRYIKNVNLPFKKDFKFAELSCQNILFLYFRDRPKNDEGNKLRKSRKYIHKSN